ncbi:hypothetical protein, partial [Aphanothece stagnina]|uniref:hypothetical protein n=1 Tax=Aphanothece stagnina TaxID=1004305 RepID=UPI00398EAF37
MKKTVSHENALNRFVQSCIDHHDGSENGDYRRVNKAYDIIMKCIRVLKENGDTEKFLPLLRHDSSGVRLWS